MRKGIKKWVVEFDLRRSLNFLTLTVVTYYLVSQVVSNWDQLKQYDYHQDPIYALLSFACLLGYFVSMAWAWSSILTVFRQTITLPQAFRILSLSQLEKYIPGGFWSLLGQVQLGSTMGVSRDALLRASLLHLLFTVLTGLEIFLFWRLVYVAEEIMWVLPGLLILITAFSLVPFCINALFDWLLRVLSQKELGDSLPHWDFAKTLRFQLLFICCWLWLGLALWLFVNSLAIVGARFYIHILGAFAASWGIGVLNFVTPAGIGTREAGLVFFLKRLFPSSEALVVALALRLWITLAELVCAMVAWKIGKKGNFSRLFLSCLPGLGFFVFLLDG